MDKQPLKLNGPVIDYKPYIDGLLVKQIPNLIKEGRNILSVADAMERQLEVLDLYTRVVDAKKSFPDKYEQLVKDLYTSWWCNCNILTGDTFVDHPAGRAKLVLDAQQLRGVNPKSNLLEGRLVLQYGEYEKLNWPEFEAKEMKNDEGMPYITYFSKFKNEKEVIDSKAWRILSRHPDEVPKEYARDPKLLQEYVHAVFKMIESTYNTQRYGFHCMPILTGPHNEYASTMNPLLLQTNIVDSHLQSGFPLDESIGHCCIVGVAVKDQDLVSRLRAHKKL